MTFGWLRSLILGGLVVAAGAVHAETPVSAVRLAGYGPTARLVIDVAGPVDFTTFALVGPDRVVIDLAGAAWRLTEPLPTVRLGPVLALRAGQFTSDTARLVIEVTPRTALLVGVMQPPSGGSGYRLVVDLGVPGGTTEALLAPRQTDPVLGLLAPIPAEPPRRIAGLPPLPRAKPTLSRSVIVIDAGHGGDDPGAIAGSGLFEKQITLAAARELADLLAATGRYEVVLTRDRDVFLSLAERVDIARRAGADLFVSLHCDALDDPSVRGATIYTVSETASDQEAQALAAKENGSDLLAGIDFVAATYDEQTTGILIDLTRRETMNGSARFAMALTEEVGKVAALRRNSHRFAGFRVLKAPDVPSVLFEMGYVSNKKDLAMLATRGERRPLLRAVVTAIDRHFALVTAYQAP